MKASVKMIVCGGVGGYLIDNLYSTSLCVSLNVSITLNTKHALGNERVIKSFRYSSTEYSFKCIVLKGRLKCIKDAMYV